MGLLPVQIEGKRHNINPEAVDYGYSIGSGTHLYLNREVAGKISLQLSDSFNDLVQAMRSAGLKVMTCKGLGAQFAFTAQSITDIAESAKEYLTCITYRSGSNTKTVPVDDDHQRIIDEYETITGNRIGTIELHTV